MNTLILDGSNIIRRQYMGPGRSFDFELEKKLADRLVQIISFLREADCRVEVYFDGKKRSVWHKDALVEVLFSEHKKADDLIVNTVADLRENYNHDVQVVSQDYNLCQRCRAYGAKIMSSNRFLAAYSAYLNGRNTAFA